MALVINIKKTKAPIGASLVVVSSVFYASYGIWTKLMGDFFGGYTASAYRSVLVLLILIPIALFYRALEPLNLKRAWPGLAGMFLGSLIIWGPLYYAILHAGIGISIASNYACYIVGMLVLGWLFNREKFSADKWLSAALGIAGLGLVFSSSFTGFGWLALSAAAISGFGAAIVMFAVKKVPYSTTQSTIAAWSASVVANTLMAFLITETRPTFDLHIEWLYMLFFAIASVIASLALVKGLKLIDAGAAGVLGLLEIVFGIIFGVVFFHERPGALVLVGAATIIIAASIPYIKEYRADQGTAIKSR